MRVGNEDLPAPVMELCRTLARHGYRGWVVGGCLRDLLRGRPAADWDLATDARPEQVQAIFPRVIPTGLQHGTVTVRHRGASYELTTLRGEGGYSDGRRPDAVHFVTDIRDDLSRRDFTINAIAYDPVSERLEDPFDGLSDLARGVLRAVGEPARRFGEDGLRVLRAARFAATLEFTIEPSTEAAIRPSLETFRRVSAERVREEWLKTFRARAPSLGFEIMRRTGILALTSPALSALPELVWEQTMRALDACRPELGLRLSALLWPLRGEPAALAEWLKRLRFTNDERAAVSRALAHAAPAGSAGWSDAEVRRYARRVGRAFVAEVCELGELLASVHEPQAAAEAASMLRRRVAVLVEPNTPLEARDLALGGRELMELLGVAPGPRLGKILDALVDRALEDPSVNTRERLLEAARLLTAEE